MGEFVQGSATRTYERRAIRIDGGGTSFTVEVAVLNAAGRVVDRFEVRVPASGVILDEDGNQIAASVPGAVNTARTSFLNAIDAAIDSAAAANKFVR
jgi:hypothetical protein